MTGIILILIDYFGFDLSYTELFNIFIYRVINLECVGIMSVWASFFGSLKERGTKICTESCRILTAAYTALCVAPSSATCHMTHGRPASISHLHLLDAGVELAQGDPSRRS